jgi:hypothetical protein
VRIPIRRYLVRLYLASLGFFVLNKLVLRPLLSDAEIPSWLEVVLYSSPNLIEAVMGTTTVAVLLLLARQRLGGRWAEVSDLVVYSVAAVLAGTWVLTQEFKLHDLGGRNVYDPLDAVASAVGVALMWLIFVRFGVLEDESPRSTPRGRRSPEGGDR